MIYPQPGKLSLPQPAEHGVQIVTREIAYFPSNLMAKFTMVAFHLLTCGFVLLRSIQIGPTLGMVGHGVRTDVLVMKTE